MSALDLSGHLGAYLAVRSALGIDVRAEAVLLTEFIERVNEHQVAHSALSEAAVDWACTAGERRGESGQARRLCVARQFLVFLRAIEPEATVPARGLLKSGRRQRPYLFNDDEILLLLDAAAALQPRHSLRPLTYRTLIGLLASTGMRVSEARFLTVDRIKLDAEVPHLEVIDTKFGKSRLVALHRSTVGSLRAYMRERSNRCFDGLSDVLLTTESGKPLDYSTLERTFRRMTRRLGMTPRGLERAPCLHSLRHTFAVRRLVEWQRADVDVHEMLPHLSTYLGHIAPESSYWYLTATPELLDGAARLFERYSDRGGDR